MVKWSIDTSIVPPVPMPRPSDRAALGNQRQQVASTDAPVDLLPANGAATRPSAPAPAVTTGSDAAAYVQISSQRSESDAQAALRNANSRWNRLFGGKALEIQRADLGNKGVYYRVRLPADSLQDATGICASIKAAGGDCFATNG